MSIQQSNGIIWVRIPTTVWGILKKQKQMEKEFKSKIFSSTYSAFRDNP